MLSSCELFLHEHFSDKTAVEVLGFRMHSALLRLFLFFRPPHVSEGHIKLFYVAISVAEFGLWPLCFLETVVLERVQNLCCSCSELRGFGLAEAVVDILDLLHQTLQLWLGAFDVLPVGSLLCEEGIR